MPLNVCEYLNDDENEVETKTKNAIPETLFIVIFDSCNWSPGAGELGTHSQGMGIGSQKPGYPSCLAKGEHHSHQGVVVSA